LLLLLYIFVANAFISPFWTHKQCIHIKSFYTQPYNYVSLKTSCPGGIRTWVVLFLRRLRCPLRHAAGAQFQFLARAGICSWLSEACNWWNQ
jgi:hypothetical protein